MRVLRIVTSLVLCVAETTLAMDFAVASPRLVAVRADLSARIRFIGTVGDAHALGRVVLNLAHASGTAVDFRARIV